MQSEVHMSIYRDSQVSVVLGDFHRRNIFFGIVFLVCCLPNIRMAHLDPLIDSSSSVAWAARSANAFFIASSEFLLNVNMTKSSVNCIT
jgi:hypothetical protein